MLHCFSKTDMPKFHLDTSLEVQQTEFFVILDQFLLFLPPNNQENKKFEKLKKTPGDIIILHMCTINDNHMIYSS